MKSSRKLVVPSKFMSCSSMPFGSLLAGACSLHRQSDNVGRCRCVRMRRVEPNIEIYLGRVVRTPFHNPQTNLKTLHRWNLQTFRREHTYSMRCVVDVGRPSVGRGLGEMKHLIFHACRLGCRESYSLNTEHVHTMYTVFSLIRMHEAGCCRSHHHQRRCCRSAGRSTNTGRYFRFSFSLSQEIHIE